MKGMYSICDCFGFKMSPRAKFKPTNSRRIKNKVKRLRANKNKK